MCGVNCGWKHSIRFHDLTAAYSNKEISVNVFCEQLANRIKAHHLATENNEMKYFGEEFLKLFTVADLNPEDVDSLLEDFYDFADDEKLLWLE